MNSHRSQPKTSRAIGLVAALGALLGRAADAPVPAWPKGGGVGTLRRGQTRKAVKPQWLQDRLMARSADKRARKAEARRRVCA